MKENWKTRIEFSLVIGFLLIPWHGPDLQRSHCLRRKSAIVRKIFEKRWVPILHKVRANLPLQCPLHPIRDFFRLHERAKLRDETRWKCGYCQQTFSQESLLESHMEASHSDKLYQGEDAVCLADYCDIMRCDVIQDHLTQLEESFSRATALESWHKPSTSSHRSRGKAVEMALPRSMIRSPQSGSAWKSRSSASSTTKETTKEAKSLPEQGNHKSNSYDTPQNHEEKENNSSDSQKGTKNCSDDKTCQDESIEEEKEGPEEVPLHPLHSWRDSCDEEKLAELRVKCQQLIQQCVSGLVLNLTLTQVKNVEEAFHRSVCWYLTCSRYWESEPFSTHEFSWGVVLAFLGMLSFGVSLCYYLVWGVCGSTIESAVTTPVSPEQPSMPTFRMQASLKPSKSIETSTDSFHEPHLPRESCYSRSLPKTAAESRRRLVPGDSESEFRDSGFNEGGIYPDFDHQETQSDVQSYRSRHYSDDSKFSLPLEDHSSNYYLQEEQRVYNYASSFTPNYEYRRLRRNRYNYLDDYETYDNVDHAQLSPESRVSNITGDPNDCFIYVSYPADGKKSSTRSNR